MPDGYGDGHVDHPPRVNEHKVMEILARHLRYEHGQSLAKIQSRTGFNRKQLKEIFSE